MQMTGKNNRILDLYDRLMNGETISKQEYADRYGVNEKSVQRDLRDIRNFFAFGEDVAHLPVGIFHKRLLPGAVRIAVEDSGSFLAGLKACFKRLRIGELRSVVGENNRKQHSEVVQADSALQFVEAVYDALRGIVLPDEHQLQFESRNVND